MRGLRIVENALIVPRTTGERGLGVLDQDGQFVAESQILRLDAPLFEPPVQTEPEDHVCGTHLFAGIMSWHFGHFLLESLSRLWPLQSPPERLDSLLFVPRRQAEIARPEMAFQSELLDIMAPGVPRQILSRPTQVERLIIPEQGFGTGNLEAGTTSFREFLRSLNWPEPQESSPKRIYVTRAGLQMAKRGRILGDDALGQYLGNRGFHVLQPERISVTEQIRMYRGAQRLIFDDGSAVHLFGLVARPGQVPASIQRRFTSETAAVGVHQLRSMADVDLKVFDAVLREWRPSEATRATSKSHAELDPRHLFEAFRGFGAVSKEDTVANLGLPSSSSVARDMEEAEYTPVERPAPLPEPPTLSRFWGVEVPDGFHLNGRKIRSLRDGFYERQEIRSAFGHIRKGDRLMELGAGSGIVGSAVALNCEVEALLSFEANPDLIPVARALYARNGLEQKAELRHEIVVAGPEAPEYVPFAVAEDYLGSKIVSEGEMDTATMRVEHVKTVLLSDVVKEFRPTALMMDIEGAELEFLENADLSRFRLVVVELHRGIYGRDGMKRCRAALGAAGLRADPDFCRRGVEVWVRESA